MSKEAAVLELPPAPSAYIEEWLDFLPPRADEDIAVLKQDSGHRDPPDTPYHHGHEHIEDGGRRPIIRSIRPTSGKPGDTITILGENFGTVQGDSFVTIGGVPAPVQP